MTIPFKAKTLEEVPEAYRGLYVEKTDKGETFFIAQIDGAAPRETVDEFRNNNIALREQNDGLLSRDRQWQEIGLEPDVVKANLVQFNDLKAQVEDKKLIAAEGFQKALESKVVGFREEMTGKLTATEKRAVDAENRAKESENKLRSYMLDTQIQGAAIDVGVRAKAMVDVRNRAVGAGWAVNDQGTPVLKDSNGITLLGKDGYPLTIREWMQGPLYEESDHLFEPSTGGNGRGNTASSNNGLNKYGGVNPWAKETRNITLQSTIAKEDPNLADQLARQAGVKRSF